VTANGGKRWQVGDVCMAKYWQDNEVHYLAVCKHILRLSPSATNVVLVVLVLVVIRFSIP